MAADAVKVHPLPVRIAHWVNAFAVLVMLTSGWQIYNADPLFPFLFPREIALGGWLAGALQWHFAGMWLFAANGLVYIAYGILSGHFRRRMFPVWPGAVARDIGDALRGRLKHHDLTVYNAAQRAAYLALIFLLVVLVLSGLVLWKPVQFYWFGQFMGDYEGARYLHFFAMAGVGVLVLIHIVMVVLVPRTFPSMITGRVKT